MIFKEDKWYVYFFRSGKTHNYKIGYSKNPYRRWMDLQVGNPYLIYKVGYIELPTDFLAKRIEKKLHDKLKKRGKHVLGEWFWLKDMYIQGLIKQIGSDPNTFIKGEDKLPKVPKTKR